MYQHELIGPIQPVEASKRHIFPNSAFGRTTDGVVECSLCRFSRSNHVNAGFRLGEVHVEGGWKQGYILSSKRGVSFLVSFLFSQ